jgi:dienelactone hydrolase
VTTVRFDGTSELRATCVLPEGGGPHPALLLVGAPASLGERLAGAGYVVVVPEDAEATGDRRTVADLEAGAAWLAGHESVDAERIGVIGFGVAAVHAFLLGCQSRRIAAVVCFQACLIYADLSSARPVQPLEMALNLSAPLLAFFGEDDAAVPAEHVERLRGVLSQFAKTFEVYTYPGAGPGFFADDEAARADACEKMLAFLSDSLV